MNADERGNRAAFEFIETMMAQAVLGAMGESALNAQLRMEGFLREFINQIFPTILALHSQNLTAPPSQLGVLWPKHAPKTLQNKDPKNAKVFMDDWGDLRTGLKSLAEDPTSGTTHFGSPGGQTRVKDGNGRVYAEYSMDRRGRWRYAKGTRDLAGRSIGGRFVRIDLMSLTRAKAELGFNVQAVVDKMKTIDAAWMAQVIGTPFAVFNFGRSRGSAGSRKYGGQPARPFLIPFLDWYTSTHFEERFKKFTG